MSTSRTLNDIVSTTTRTCLDELDTEHPPAPRELEAELLEKVNARIELENADPNRPKGNKLPFLKTLTFSQIADIMLRLHRICRISVTGDRNTDPDYDLLAMYATEGEQMGVHVTNEDALRSVARQYNYNLTTNDFKEVLAALRDQAPQKQLCTEANLIAVNNGIFDFDTKKLLDFNPDKVFLSKSPIDFDPDAELVQIVDPMDGTLWDVESWMATLHDDPELVELCWQMIGACIRPLVSWNKSAWLYATGGNNGKGTYCALVRNVVGQRACASIPLADFGKDFHLEPLIWSSAIVVDENDVGTFVDKAANLKSIITGDVFTINRKHKSPVAYQFHGFMIQCLNEFPRIKDKSESFYRRQLFVPFTKSFKGIEKRHIKGDFLKRPEVLRYVLKRVLMMDYYALNEPAITQQALAEYKEANDPVRMFYNEMLEEFTWDLLPFTFLYELYVAWSRTNNPSGSPVSQRSFTQEVIELANEEGTFTCENERLKVRPAGRMDRPEPLISTYDLRNWKNPINSGNRSDIPKLAASYRGLVRTGTLKRQPFGLVDDAASGEEPQRVSS